jgi:cation:H+ antiporter
MRSLGLVVAGLAGLVVGGRLLVDGAVQLAQLAGLTERVIGLTIVAAGTSAPELAASLAAARRKHSDIAVANLLGSNIFNILGILGITAVITPIPVSPEIIRSDAWWMLGAAVALFPLMRVGRKITRLDGSLMLAAYAVYLALLLLT